MSSTPNLGIVLISSNQSQKEVTANSAFIALDQAQNGELSIAMSDANLTLTAAQVTGAFMFVFTGALTADRNVNIPAAKRFFAVENSTTGGHSLVVRTGIGQSVSVPAGVQILYCDGTNVISLTPAAGVPGATLVSEDYDPTLWTRPWEERRQPAPQFDQGSILG